MTAKLQPQAAPLYPSRLATKSGRAPHRTSEEQVQDIQALHRRVTEYVQFMSKVNDLKGTSAEAKEKAIAAFHGRLAALERELGRIHDELMLG